MKRQHNLDVGAMIFALVAPEIRIKDRRVDNRCFESLCQILFKLQ